MNTSKTFSVFFILFFVLISSTYAHFEFQNPPLRGHNEDTMSQPPCGGFNDVNATAISPFPVTEGQVTTSFEDGNGVLIINYAPTTSGPFKLVSDNSTVNIAEGTGPKQIVTLVDLSKAGAKSGDQGVLQAIYSGEMNTTWYQCADIKVVDAKKANGASNIAGTTATVFFMTTLVSLFMF